MIRFTLLLICLPLFSFAQLSDDFSDGDFTANPVWTGTAGKFKVNNNKQLQLYDSVASMAFLSTANSMATDCEWRFWIKFSFSPSSNNNGRIYLISDAGDLTGPVHGYFLQLGESGSNDAIELFRQDGETVTSVCRGSDGLIASSFQLGIKVTRAPGGIWTLSVDKDGSGIYLPEASGEDTVYQTTSFFGIVARYTVSNAKKFYWDDFFIGNITVDNEPPEVQYLTPLSDSVLLVKFNEPVDPVSAQDNNHYHVSPDVGNPDQVSVNGEEVLLHFANKFQNNTVYTITVSGIADLAGNVMETYQGTFTYSVAESYDVVFNEIFPDPNPPVGLPPFEFIELFNRTDHLISLNNWKLTVGSSEKVIEDAVIPAYGFLILAKEDAREALSPYGLFYGFSSFSLTNAGQQLILSDKGGQIIDRVYYRKSWYGDPEKEDGGWSLEKINPDDTCSEAENWTASVAEAGGTPGSENSVLSTVLIPPRLTGYTLLGEDVLELTFSQKMNKNALADVSHYTIEPEIGHPAGAFPDMNNPAKVGLYFDIPWDTGVFYSLTVDGDLTNCMGLPIGKDTIIRFGIPEKISAQDVIINEVLFNPWSGGEDYVELYNRSEKLLDAADLMLGGVRISPPNPPDTTWYAVSSSSRFLFPGDYLLLTKSPEKVMSQYYTENPNAFLGMESFPSYNNDRGTVLIKTDTTLVDAFTYDESMQYPLLHYVEGVALERIDPDAPTQDLKNWHSAAESVGFGTPGYKNSQRIIKGSEVGEITVSPEVFSPDNDGMDDVLSIRYHFKNPGNNLTVDIFNHNGKHVKKLTDNEYVGTEGVVFWDGLTDENTKAPVGIYILYIKAFNADGNVQSWKKPVVVATRW